MDFEKSALDNCLYFHDDLIFVHYVDDGIIESSNPAKIEAFKKELASHGFDFGEEEDYAGYLGVDIKNEADGSIHLTQTGLIDRILDDLGLVGDSGGKDTPATGPLGPFKDHPPFNDSFNYRSVLGKTMYLSSNTRCEIAFANHQCARFANDAREPHGTALKRIGRYLLKTRTKGMIIKPTKDLTLDCYVDADFAGLFKVYDKNDPNGVKSRTGFAITLGGIPVSWQSKLQSETALSTLEAEYIALSQAMRVLLVLRTILTEVSTALHLHDPAESVIRSSIFEDNQACYLLATSDPPKMTPRSKSIAVKYHWFREHLEPDVVVIRPIQTEEQPADIFTKALPSKQFNYLRKKLLGW